MADEKRRMYQFGSHELDYDNYLANLDHNVSKYLESQGWNDGQRQEFMNTYNDFITAYRLDDSDTNRFSSDAFGNITDNTGEMFQDENEDTYYDTKGNSIGRHQYAELSNRKRNKYSGFDARNNVMKYFRDIANEIIKKRGTNPTNSNKFNFNDHGFFKYWSNKVNPAGGEFNMKPFLDKDELINGRRSRNNRAAYFSEQLGDYITNLQDQDYDFSENVFGSKEKYIEALEALRAKLDDGTFDANDAQAALAAGIDQKFFDQFFTEYDVYKTDEEAKKEQETQQAQANKEAHNKWVDEQWKKYYDSRGDKNYNTENGLTLGKLDELFRDANGNFDHTAFSNHFTQEKFKNYYTDGRFSAEAFGKAWAVNPFDTSTWNLEDTRAFMAGLIGTEKAQKIKSGALQGMYYIPGSTSYDTNSTLVYDPTTGKLFRAFLGDVPTVWEEMKTNANLAGYSTNNGASAYYAHKNGGVIKFQSGGGFEGMDILLKQGYEEQLKNRAKESNRTERQQKAAERFIDSDYKTGDNDAGWETEEYARLVSAAADVASALTAYIPTVGTAASAITGVGSTISNLVADIADESVTTWDTVKNLGFGLGMDAIGLIPGVGTGAKTAKIMRTVTKIAPKVMKWLWMYSAATNSPQMLASWEKVINKDAKMTSEDWRNIMESLNLVLSGAAAQGRGFKAKGTIDTNDVEMPHVEKLVGDKIALKVKDAAGKEKRIVIEGTDAAKIREANEKGDFDKVKELTIDKYQDLKDHSLIQSANPVKSFRNPIQGWNPKKWRSPYKRRANIDDVYTSGGVEFVPTKGDLSIKQIPTEEALRIDAGFITPRQAWKDLDDAFVESQLGPVRKAAATYEANLGKKAAKQSKLDKDIDIQRQTLNGRKSSDLEKQLKDIQEKSKSTDYLHWKANSANIEAKLATKEAQVKDLEDVISDLDTKITKETDASKITKLQNLKDIKVQALTTLKSERDKLRLDIQSFKQLDKALEPTNLDALKDEITTTKVLEQKIQDLLNERQKWDKFVEDGKTKERTQFEAKYKKDAEGNVTFHDPSTGRTITRKFDELLKDIKFKKGGSIKKFQTPAGPLTLTDYEKQAALWRQQRNGVMPTTTPSVTTPVMPTTPTTSTTLSPYDIQSQRWLLQRNGQEIPEELQEPITPTNMTASVTTSNDVLTDTSEAAARHLGTITGSAEDVEAFRKKASAATNTEGAKTGYVQNGKQKEKKPSWWKGVGNEFLQNMNGLMQDPNLLFGVPRALADIQANRRMTDLMIQGEKPILERSLNLSPVTVYSDLAGELAARSNAAQLTSMANQPLTSDGRLQTALQFDALLKGQQTVDQGKQKSDEVYLRQMAAAKQQQDIEDTKNLAVANKNNQAMLATQNNIKKHQAALVSKEQSIKDTLSQAFEKDYRTRQLENAQYEEALFKKDQKALELDNAINGKYSGELTPSQIQALKLYKAGNTAGMREIERADLNKALEIINNKVLTAWAAKRKMSRVYNPTVTASPASTDTGFNILPVNKKGGTIDNSFQKMILATIKENNKKIENLSKTMTNYFKDIKKK